MAKIDWKDADGTITSVTSIYPRGRRQYTAVFTYEVDGHLYEGTLNTFKACNERDSIPVRYDAANPEVNELTLNQERRTRIVYTVLALSVGLPVGLILYFMIGSHLGWFN